MKIFNKSLLVAALAASVMFTSCDEEETEIPNENELITTVILELYDESNPNNEVHLHWEDIDLDGKPEIETEALAANTTYHGHIEFLNELAEKDEDDHDDEDGHNHRTLEDDHDHDHEHDHGYDVTETIEKEDEDHQVFYVVDPADLATIEYEDEDGNGMPLGLEIELTTGDAGTGTLNIVLKHEPTKSKDATLETAGGSTDIDVKFDITVE
ncbi:hypothetical protein [Reichenbachiella versicolor]|uniref:hypothetical protein n=1 Tax=Reichenbachiella versicolor TaxID=1821036 RepID=UPI0013A533F4|nr:hypothetical protein [Reichenbachiella versicolor]